MGSFEGKRGLIFGVANKNSIAWGIAQALAEEGATVGFSYAGEALQKRVAPLAESVGSSFVEECDVTDDGAIDELFIKVEERMGKIDFWYTRLHSPLERTSAADLWRQAGMVFVLRLTSAVTALWRWQGGRYRLCPAAAVSWR